MAETGTGNRITTGFYGVAEKTNRKGQSMNNKNARLLMTIQAIAISIGQLLDEAFQKYFEGTNAGFLLVMHVPESSSRSNAIVIGNGSPEETERILTETVKTIQADREYPKTGKAKNFYMN